VEQNKEILIFNRYVIEKKIAAGGMADIFLGEDIKLKRKVAVKVLSVNYAGDRNFVARFRNEAQVLAKLDHPNIVDVYDWGKFNNSYYIIMEYVEGISLKELIEKKGSLEPKTATRYAVQICDALGAAHENNLIHRDIKPQNLLISPDNKIIVTDFGIAKFMNTDITKTLSIVGTAHYISPEQARGSVLDNRTDIYSLGIVIYEMLTGDLPFRGDTSIDISLKHINEKPVRPTDLIKTVPGKLEKIVMVCLKKDPSERYFSIDELKKDLNNYLEVRPLLLGVGKRNFFRSGSLPERLKRNTVALIASLLAAIFLGLSLVYSVLYYQKESIVLNEIRVPPLENIHIETAEDILSIFDLELVLAGERNSPFIPEGYIIEQSPEANSIIKENGKVRVIISAFSNLAKVEAPNIIGLEVDQALELLEEEGLVLGVVSSESSDLFEIDIIIEHSPPFGTAMSRGDSIDIVVSKGPEKIIVPNIKGLELTYALRHLEALGIKVITKIVPVDDENTQPGMVLMVDPQPGTALSIGDVIEVGVSVLEPLNEVPGLVGINIIEAVIDLESRGIIYEIIYVDPDYSFQKDEVLEQLPKEGQYLTLNTPVVLFVGK